MANMILRLMALMVTIIDTLVTKMAELISKVATMIYIKMIVTQKWQ